MARSVYKNKEFLKLRWEWYEKLKKSGFNDIEFHVRSNGDTMPMLNGMNATDMVKMLTRWGASKVEYYRLAEQQLAKVGKEFGTRSWQYKAWKIHSDGHGIRTITRLLGVTDGEARRLIRKQQAEIFGQQQIDDVEEYRD